MSQLGYIGSKKKLMPWIKQTVDDFVDPSDHDYSVGDVFAGTGNVGYYFKNSGHQVYENDLQYYSYVINYAYNRLNKEPFADTKLVLKKINEYVNDEKNLVPGFVAKNYSKFGSDRNYFTELNAKKIDTVRNLLDHKLEYGKINNDQYMYLLASLIEASDKVANTTSVYGAYLKSVKKGAKKPLKLLPIKVIDNHQKNFVYKLDANDLVKVIDPTIVYMDPPYNTRQYSSNYHVLETIAKNDNPEIHGKTGLREVSENQSDYSKKRLALDAFTELVKNTKSKYVFVSYNNEGIMSLNDMLIAFAGFKKVKVARKVYQRYKADNNRNNHSTDNTTVEYLICAQK